MMTGDINQRFDINYNICDSETMFVSAVSRSDGPTPARQSGNKDLEWEQIEIFSLKQSVANLFNRSPTFISPSWCRHGSLGLTFQLFGPKKWSSARKGHFFLGLATETGAWTIPASKSINPPKSGKVCLVMSSDWSLLFTWLSNEK